MSLSFGPFLTCFIATTFLTVCFYYAIYVKKIMLQQTSFFVSVILLIFIRMMIPLNFPFTYTIYSKKVLPVMLDFLYYPIGESNFLLVHIFYIVWVLGSVFCAVKLLRGNLKWYSCLKRYSLDRESDQIKRLKAIFKEELNLEKIELACVPGNEVPAIFFGIKPILILPDIEKYTDLELEQMCKHELNHYKKKDLLLIVCMNIVCCIQWWNPLIYLLKHEFKLLLELSNDYQLMAQEPDFNKVKYAELILKVAKLSRKNAHDLHLMSEPSLNFVGKSRSNLSTRIHYILDEKIYSGAQRKSKLYNFVMLAVFILTFFIVAEPTYEIKEEHIEGSVEITPENAYILQENDEFHIYVEGDFFCTISTIPEDFDDIPVYTKSEMEMK